MIAAVLGADCCARVPDLFGPSHSLLPFISSEVDESSEASLGEAGVNGSVGPGAALVLVFRVNFGGTGSDIVGVWSASWEAIGWSSFSFWA